MKKLFWSILGCMFLSSVSLVACGLAYSAENKLCEAAFTAPVESGTPKSPVLMLMIDEWSETGWHPYTHQLIPAPEDSDAKTLVCIRQSRTKTEDVYYPTIYGLQSSTPADVTPYQLTWDIRLVELATGNVIASEVNKGSDPPSSVSNSDKHVDVYGDEPTTALFKLLRPTLGPVFFVDHAIQEIAFSPDGRFLASAGSFNLDLEAPNLMMWDMSSGEIAVAFDNPDMTFCLAFSPDGKALATCSVGRKDKLRVWDTISGKLLYELDGEIDKVAYSPDGKLLAAGGGRDDLLLVMDAASGEIIYTREVETVFSLAFSPDGKILAFGSNKLIQFLDPGSGEEIGILPVSSNYHLSFSSDGQRLATSGSYGRSSALRLWDFDSRQVLQTFEDGVGSVISPDGALIAQANFCCTVFLWDVNTGKKVDVITGFKGPIYGLAYSPDGRWLAIGSAYDGMILLYDMAKDK